MIECVSRPTQVEITPTATDGMRHNIDQTAVDNIREKLLRDLSFNAADIDELIGWCAKLAPVV